VETLSKQRKRRRKKACLSKINCLDSSYFLYILKVSTFVKNVETFFMKKIIDTVYGKLQQGADLVTDSRKITSGCIYVALKGPRFNGNTFAEEALEKGAAYVVLDEETYVKNEDCLLVSSGLKFLQKLAQYHRRQFSIPVIAITGSNGKTTTKELLAAVMKTTYKIHYTQGNFNNHIGVPLTLLKMPPETEVAIIEMGANHQGEIAALCEIAEPTHGIITNIGKAHLEGFGGLEGVKKGKSELYTYLAKNNGVAFINQDEKYLEELAEQVNHKIFYLESENPDKNIKEIEIKLNETQPFLVAEFLAREKMTTVFSALVGRYNFGNLMTAIALGKYFKVPSEAIKIAIQGYVPQNNRSELRKIDSNTFILDAYNANPTSTTAALDNFEKIEATNKIIILGDMLELGQYSKEAHREILDRLKEIEAKAIYVVGPHYKTAILSSDKVSTYPDVSTIKAELASNTWEDSHLILTGGLIIFVGARNHFCSFPLSF